MKLYNRKILSFLISTFLLAIIIAISSYNSRIVYAAEEVAIGTLESTLQGTNEPGSTVEETTLGDVIADAVLETTDADLAIIPGGIIYYNLQGGEVTEEELRSLFSSDQSIVKVVFSIDELTAFLENGVSHITVGTGDTIDDEVSSFDGFPQISGFSFAYDASALSGERVYEIIIDDENVLESEGSEVEYEIAMTLEMVNGEYGYSVDQYEETEWTVSDCLVEYFTDSYITVPELDRITCRGVLDNSIISQISPLTLIIVCVVIIALYGMNRKEKKVDKDFANTVQ